MPVFRRNNSELHSVIEAVAVANHTDQFHRTTVGKSQTEVDFFAGLQVRREEEPGAAFTDIPSGTGKLEFCSLTSGGHGSTQLDVKTLPSPSRLFRSVFLQSAPSEGRTPPGSLDLRDLFL